MRIRSAAVLGAGTMGAQIAAHLANAGVPSLLLDVSLDAARQGLKRAQGTQARSVLHQVRRRRSSRPGSFDDLSGLRSCDWIIEAVVERLDVKQALIERVERDASRHRHRLVEHVGHSDRRASPRAAAPPSESAGWERISSIRRDTWRCSR